MALSPALRKLRQEDRKLQANLDCIVRPCVKGRTGKTERKKKRKACIYQREDSNSVGALTCKMIIFIFSQSHKLFIKRKKSHPPHLVCVCLELLYGRLGIPSLLTSLMSIYADS